MKKISLKLLIFLCSFSFCAQVQKIHVSQDIEGMKLMIDGNPTIINGMNWDYFPIGTNYSYSLWSQSDQFIKEALDAEMALLQNMGVNTIRMYTGIQPKWITYIYENYGIYTMLNHPFGRYGLTINGAWVPVTDYSNSDTKKILLAEVQQLALQYKNTKGLLLYLLGNENNYGLFWAGAETEDFPDEEKKRQAVGEKRGRPMYRLMNEASKIIKKVDSNRPVAICNGDLLFIDIVAEECKDIDIYGTNVYRGISFRDLFEVAKQKLDMPVMFTEFGADAFNAKNNQEDQKMQAYYNLGNWKEIYQNAAGLGKSENSIGGFTFQFSDGWWKKGQTSNLDIHDNEATWSNGGYRTDMAYEGANNMNEEWFGICAKGPTNAQGFYTLYPRAAYYVLKEAHKYNPFALGASSSSLENHFAKINLMDGVLKARGDKAALGGGSKLEVSRLTANFSTYQTGGSLITTPETPNPDEVAFPNQLGFDHMQSYFVGLQATPAPNMRANVNFNVLGNVAQNPIDEIFYENVGRPVVVKDPNGQPLTLTDVNRLRIYSAAFEWNTKDFDVRGFYRTGHYHWGYEGDFFGLYPEANYGPNLDIYNGEIMGVEVDGKGAFNGLKAALGPQLWWGANPTALLKYRKRLGHWNFTGIYHRDFETGIIIDENTGQRILDANQLRSGIIPAFPTERATVVLEKEFGNFELTLGGIWAGSPLNGTSYQDIHDNGAVVIDRVKTSDNWGWKGKLTFQKGTFNWYAQGGVMGLVANGGSDQTQTFTGWKLKDNGSGNQSNFLTGLAYTIGNLQVAPNFLWQKPLVDPMPSNVGGAGRLRNVIDDPFAVRWNRETTAGEILFTFDPTPGSWMYQWDNDRAEDAKFAANLGFVYRHLPTTMDAHIGFLANRTFFAFPNSAPAQNLWEVHSRMVSKISPDFGIIGNFYYGNGQANGDSDRTITRFGGDVRVIYEKMKIISHLKINDWGPFDYHRDFNLTFPLQLMLDVSTTLGKPDWFVLPSTTIGIRGAWRSLNEFSPRYAPNQTVEFATVPILSPIGFPNGSEWEIRTYININLGK